MEKLFKIIFSKKVITVFLILIQIGIFIGAYVFFNDNMRYIWSASHILAFALVIYEINKDSSPAFTITWIVLILAIPFIGSILYIFLHAKVISNGIGKKLLKNINDTKEMMRQADDVTEMINARYPSERGLMYYLNQYCGFPAHRAEDIKYYPLGDVMFPDMLEALRCARRFIFLEFFIINASSRMWNEILEILKNKTAEGVEVRLMYDGMGSMQIMPGDSPEELEKFGIQCRIFAPIVPFLSTHQNNRDHRKILVIDGETAFTGGINLADEYINERERFGHWKDTGARFRGSAVNSFTMMFLQMWNVLSSSKDKKEIYSDYLVHKDGSIGTSEGITIPFSDSPLDNDRIAEQTYLDILNTADRYVHIMTPYLVLDNIMMDAMKYAAKRGVDVKIIMPHIPDKVYAFMLARTYYKELMLAGVQIYEYTPGFIHAKSSVSDDKKAVIGTINHDFRSMYLHYECGAYIIDHPVITDMEDDFQYTLLKSHRMTYKDLEQIPLHTKILSKILRLLAPLM